MTDCAAERGGFVRHLDDAPMGAVKMDGAVGASMAVMVGRADGAPNFALRQFAVEAGGHTPRHQHDYEHEVFVVSGTGTVLLGGEEQPIRVGDVVYVPANAEHQFRATGESGLRFLCVVPIEQNCGGPVPGS